MPAPLAPADDVALKRSKRRRVFAHVAVAVAVLGAETYIFARGSKVCAFATRFTFPLLDADWSSSIRLQDVIDMFMRVLCAGMYQIALAVLFAQLLQAFKFSVHRRPDGCEDRARSLQALPTRLPS